MIEQQEGDTGFAVALMSCSAVFMGSLGMVVISQERGDTVRVLGGHEHPGGTCMLGIVGAIGREIVCQADT